MVVVGLELEPPVEDYSKYPDLTKEKLKAGLAAQLRSIAELGHAPVEFWVTRDTAEEKIKTVWARELTVC